MPSGNYAKKIIGTAMGSVPSPEDCDILMFDILHIFGRLI
jgi:hypothetical protein